MRSGIRFTLAAAALSSVFTTACAQQSDFFNEVGKGMAIQLQNSHFSQLPFNRELSRRFLDTYLRDLDPQRLYFTAGDVKQFQADYGDHLHTLLLRGNSQEAARKIYGVFLKRVEQRVAVAEKIPKETEFDFSEKDQTLLSRKNAPWPKDEQEASVLWKKQIKEAVLKETLRRELLSKLAKEQGKSEPGSADRSPKEKVALRYKRFRAEMRDANEEEIANYFLSAVARSYDPHTEYLDFRKASRFMDEMKNELEGIGAVLQSEEDGATKIMGIVVGGPADLGGDLKLNDRVVGVDQFSGGRPEDMVDIMFMKTDKVVSLIRGKQGTSVTLKVEPASGAPGETKLVKITRAKVELKAEQASGELLEYKADGNKPARRVGVITLPSFYADLDGGKVRCSMDVERILKRLVEEKIDGLVLDLRRNGGGSLEEVRRMTGFFIERGPVVQVKNKLERISSKESDADRPLYNGPMVVMTDRASASASEILAGALQDHNRAVIVGDASTFGKGTVQQVMKISDMMPVFSASDRAGFLKPTIQKFYRPSGSSTQLDGVKADVLLPSLMDAYEIGEQYLEYPLPHDMIRRASDFKPLDSQLLFIPRLAELSQERLKQNKDFQYLNEDVLKAKKRKKENIISLNVRERKKELEESEELQKKRNAECKERFAKMASSDKAKMSFYKITLDDLDKVGELKPYDPSVKTEEYMRVAKDEAEDLDDTPEWPSGLDPAKRESLEVVKDLVNLTENARLTGIMR